MTYSKSLWRQPFVSPDNYYFSNKNNKIFLKEIYFELYMSIYMTNLNIIAPKPQIIIISNNVYSNFLLNFS